jgi:hypothetical protein
MNTSIIYKLEINVFNETNVGKNRLTILASGNIGHKTQKEDKKKTKKNTTPKAKRMSDTDPTTMTFPL